MDNIFESTSLLEVEEYGSSGSDNGFLGAGIDTSINGNASSCYNGSGASKSGCDSSGIRNKRPCDHTVLWLIFARKDHGRTDLFMDSRELPLDTLLFQSGLSYVLGKSKQSNAGKQLVCSGSVSAGWMPSFPVTHTVSISGIRCSDIPLSMCKEAYYLQLSISDTSSSLPLLPAAPNDVNPSWMDSLSISTAGYVDKTLILVLCRSSDGINVHEELGVVELPLLTCEVSSSSPQQLAFPIAFLSGDFENVSKLRFSIMIKSESVCPTGDFRSAISEAVQQDKLTGGDIILTALRFNCNCVSFFFQLEKSAISLQNGKHPKISSGIFIDSDEFESLKNEFYDSLKVINSNMLSKTVCAEIKTVEKLVGDIFIRFESYLIVFFENWKLSPESYLGLLQSEVRLILPYLPYPSTVNVGLF